MSARDAGSDAKQGDAPDASKPPVAAEGGRAPLEGGRDGDTPDAPTHEHDLDAGDSESSSRAGDGAADATTVEPPCADDDADGVCNAVDVCPGFDDRQDQDHDGRPDGCEPKLLRDINTATGDSFVQPSFAQFGDSVFFSARDGHSWGIWRTSAEGTGASKVFSAASDQSYGEQYLTVAGGHLFFYDVYGGSSRLWRLNDALNDGVLVKGGGGNVDRLQAAGDLVYFVMGNDELWRSDGTEAGTTVVFTNEPIAGAPQIDMLSSGGLLFFIGSTGSYMTKLFRTDGTVAGTFQVTPEFEEATGTSTTMGQPLASLGGRVYFRARNPDSDTQDSVWSTDGTLAGTHPAFANPPAPFSPESLVASADALYIVSDSGDVWRSAGDGDTPVETGLAANFAVTAGNDVYGYSYYPDNPRNNIVRLDGATNTLAETYDPIGDGHFTTLFGAASGAYLVDSVSVMKDGDWVYSSTVNRLDSTGETQLMTCGRPPSGVTIGDRLFFAPSTLMHGIEPWVTDGTVGGTHEIADINTEGLSSNPSGFCSSETATSPVVFTATSPGGGPQPWITFGDTASTVPLTAAAVTTTTGVLTPWLVAGSTQFFLMSSQNSSSAASSLWRVDSTGALVSVDLAGMSLSAGDNAVVSGADVYFLIGSQLGVVPLASLTGPAPTFAGMTDVPNVSPDQGLRFAEWGGHAYNVFGSSLESHLWRVDGANTVVVRSDLALKAPLATLTDGMYFAATVGSGTDLEIYRSDGADAGTNSAANLAASGITLSYILGTPLGNRLYFVGSDSQSHRLFRLEGTNAIAVGDLIPPDSPTTPVVVGQKMFLVDAYSAIWVTDGTSAGTTQLTGSTQVAELTSYHGLVYFTADDGVHGRELWRTDGTLPGTFMEADIVPGSTGSSPTGLHAAGDALYFSAYSDGIGTEPWVMRH